jgi:biopolymer transport protein ExbB
MNFRFGVDLAFEALYVCVGLLIFVILERAIYFTYIALRARRLTQFQALAAISSPDLGAINSSDPISRAVVQYAKLLTGSPSREQQEDVSSALYIGVDKKISARLWILDTIVTAAPLLGLLGTIFGIMETFTALSAGGISDPATVSRGIATALRATALGITAALLGLLGNNILSRRAHVLTEDFKAILLSLTRDHVGP